MKVNGNQPQTGVTDTQSTPSEKTSSQKTSVDKQLPEKPADNPVSSKSLSSYAVSVDGKEKASKKKSNDSAFPSELKPGGKQAVSAQIKTPYTPDTSNDFWSEVVKAKNEGVKFVACLVDCYGLNSLNIMEFVSFCKDKGIEIINVEFDIYHDHGKETFIADRLPAGTPTVVKSTQSMFSSEDMHKQLEDKAPDALIVAGEYLDSCIRSSIMGIKEGTVNHDKYGDEFGAVEYGFPVYSHFGLIRRERSMWGLEEYNKLEGDNFHKFGEPDVYSPDSLKGGA